MPTHPRVWDLYRQGWPAKDIARYLGIRHTTTYHHLKSEAFPERRGRNDAERSPMDLWAEGIIKRWNKGQQNGRQTFGDLRAKSFIGDYVTVLRYINRLSDAQHGPRWVACTHDLKHLWSPRPSR